MWKGREQTSISGKQKINDLKYNNISISTKSLSGWWCWCWWSVEYALYRIISHLGEVSLSFLTLSQWRKIRSKFINFLCVSRKCPLLLLPAMRCCTVTLRQMTYYHIKWWSCVMNSCNAVCIFLHRVSLIHVVARFQNKR